MKKETKIIVLVFAIVVSSCVLFFGAIHMYMAYHDAKFFDQLDRIQVGMPFEQVKESLPYRIYRECLEQQDVEIWADTKDEQILKTCHLYIFYDSSAMQYILIYVDKDAQTVRHISTRHA